MRGHRLRRGPRMALLGLLALVLSGAGVLALANAGALHVPSRLSPLVSDDGEGRAGPASSKPRVEKARHPIGVPRPRPRNANSDRGLPAKDGCFVNDGESRPQSSCVYGKRNSDTTVVLFGDSKALHYFPALEPVARKRGWRLLVLVKAGCPPMAIVKRGEPGETTECERWREAAFDRIGSAKGRRLVITSGNVDYQGIKSHGRTLAGEARDAAVRASYAAALERLRRLGTRVAVIKDNPVPPRDIPSCVSRSLDRLGRCAFHAPAGFQRGIEERAAAAVEGAGLIDVTDAVCSARRCPAVIDGVLVYRNTAHFTATFARTLAPVVGRQLPRIG